jgi:hypothetical protein
VEQELPTLPEHRFLVGFVLLDLYSFMQGRIQDFKLGGGALKKIAPNGGRREKFWGISCEKSRFYAKKKYDFFGVKS